MEWDDKSLSQKEIEVLFAVLNEQHDEIIRGVKKVIQEFASMENHLDESESENNKKKAKPKQALQKLKITFAKSDESKLPIESDAISMD